MQKATGKIVRVPLYFLSFVVIILLFAFLTFKLLSFSRTVDVPDVSGKSLIEANEILSKKGLNLKIDGEDYNADVPAGHIIRQDLPFANKVKEQRSVRVVVSKGPGAQSVPSVTGETLSKAEAIFLQNGLKVSKIIRVHSNSVEKDVVIAQKPAGGENLADKITLIVSSGQYETVYYAPDFQGMKKEEAVQLAEKLGLKANAAGSGEIIKSQKPKPGTQVKAGDAVYMQTEEE